MYLFGFRSDIDTLQFQMTFEIPHIRVKAQYRSSGVLILVKASGAGDYWGEYGNRNEMLLFVINSNKTISTESNHSNAYTILHVS